MHDHHGMVPRQIYTSTLSRRDRRWTSRPRRAPLGASLVGAAALLATLVALLALTPGLG
jgi:hypothetical protein